MLSIKSHYNAGILNTQKIWVSEMYRPKFHYNNYVKSVICFNTILANMLNTVSK